MELRVLRYFLAVAREENITKAAALQIDQFFAHAFQRLAVIAILAVRVVNDSVFVFQDQVPIFAM